MLELIMCLPKLRRAQELQEAIVREQPRVLFYKFNLAFICRSLGRADPAAVAADAVVHGEADDDDGGLVRRRGRAEQVAEPRVVGGGVGHGHGDGTQAAHG